MHIPDGFLDAPTALATAALATTGVGLAVTRLSRTLPERRVPAVGLAAAFVFAAQMLNFPVGAGTSGHLVGAALATSLLGAGATVVVMTSVLVLQCFLFADGGLTALGANVFNMALVAPYTAALVMVAVRRVAGAGARARLFGAAFGAWCSTMAAALACTGELATSGTAPWGVAWPAMGLVHAVIGLGEAAITALVLASLARLAPERAESPATGGPLVARLAPALVVSLGLALFVAPFASPWPDGLERVAERLGFAHRAQASLVSAPLPDDGLPGWAGGASVATAGAIGVLVAFALAWALAAALGPRAGRGGAPPRA